MNLFNRIIECKICNDTLKSPIILPCGDSVCKSHCNDDENELYCKICDKNHEKPIDGFPTNKLAESLLKSKIDEFEFGEQYKSALMTCSGLERSIALFDMLNKSAIDFIDIFIEKIKNKIDIKREERKFSIEQDYNSITKELIDLEINSGLRELNDHIKNLIESYFETKSFKIIPNDDCTVANLKEKILIKKEEIILNIDEPYLEFIKDLEDFKQDCIQKLPDPQDLIEESLIKKVDEARTKFKQSMEYLQIFKVDDKNWKKIKQETDKIKEGINRDLLKLKNRIFLEKGFDFELKQFHFASIQTLRDNRKVFRLEVRNVACYVDTNLKTIHGEKQLINGIQFSIGVRFLRTKDKVLNLLACILCENDYEFRFD